MKRFLVILIFLNSNWGFSQLNLDSLMTELKNSQKFVKLGYGDRFSFRESFLQFESIDKRTRYEVNIDSTGKVSEYLGVAFIYKTFDSQGRTTKQIGYRLDGSYLLWDFSPITEWHYNGNTTVQTFYDHKYIYTDKVTKVQDNNGRVIEMVEETTKSINYRKTVFQYDDNLHSLTTIYYDRKGSLKPDKNGAAIIYQKKDAQDSLIIEEKYFDAKNRLVDANHVYTITSTSLGYIFSTVNYKTNEYGQFLAYFYNSKGELVGCAETEPPYSIITFQTIQE